MHFTKHLILAMDLCPQGVLMLIGADVEIPIIETTRSSELYRIGKGNLYRGERDPYWR